MSTWKLRQQLAGAAAVAEEDSDAAIMDLTAAAALRQQQQHPAAVDSDDRWTTGARHDPRSRHVPLNRVDRQPCRYAVGGRLPPKLRDDEDGEESWRRFGRRMKRLCKF